MVNKKIKSLKQKEKTLHILKDVMLMLALFFNPFGFDIVQYSLIVLMGSLWKANCVLYSIAGLFFGLYIWVTRLLNKETSD